MTDKNRFQAALDDIGPYAEQKEVLSVAEGIVERWADIKEALTMAQAGMVLPVLPEGWYYVIIQNHGEEWLVVINDGPTIRPYLVREGEGPTFCAIKDFTIEYHGPKMTIEQAMKE